MESGNLGNRRTLRLEASIGDPGDGGGDFVSLVRRKLDAGAGVGVSSNRGSGRTGARGSHGDSECGKS